MISPFGFLLAVAVAFTADQVTKVVALQNLNVWASVAILPGLNLTLGFNDGISFGILADTVFGQPLILVTLTGLLTCYLCFLGGTATRPLEGAGYGSIVGGSLGNIVDRLRQGAVTDFLDIYWSDWHWPTFNVADIAIVVGVAAIALSAFSTPAKT
ncbi:signal peptidase II [Aureimonas sp. SK2]|uniref:signal peptidase II n=1 Tax=Aureimonas sp. SK2 TaxID=3015992 RepID=UPI002443C75A|nr:signal peptidase II [Aureimonas sp. SK2]